MKTIREHLETLPEPYRAQALENHAAYPMPNAPESFESLLEAFYWAFDWDGSTERFDYWCELSDRIESNTL